MSDDAMQWVQFTRATALAVLAAVVGIWAYHVFEHSTAEISAKEIVRFVGSDESRGDIEVLTHDPFASATVTARFSAGFGADPYSDFESIDVQLTALPNYRMPDTVPVILILQGTARLQVRDPYTWPTKLRSESSMLPGSKLYGSCDERAKPFDAQVFRLDVPRAQTSGGIQFVANVMGTRASTGRLSRGAQTLVELPGIEQGVEGTGASGAKELCFGAYIFDEGHFALWTQQYSPTYVEDAGTLSAVQSVSYSSPPLARSDDLKWVITPGSPSTTGDPSAVPSYLLTNQDQAASLSRRLFIAGVLAAAAATLAIEAVKEFLSSFPLGLVLVAKVRSEAQGRKASIKVGRSRRPAAVARSRRLQRRRS